MIIIILLLVGIYIFLSAPSLRKLDLSKYIDIDYAHRGFHNDSDAPENSLLAIKRAVDNSYGMEYDIRLSKDGQIVLFHDDDLKRMCGVDKNVRDLTYNQLLEFKLLNSEEKIPLFTDVLKIVDGQEPMIVELKCPREDVDELASKTAELLDQYKGTFMVESFNPYAMKWFKDNRPEYIRGQLSSGYFKGLNIFINILMSELFINFLSRPDFIAYEHKYRDKFSLWIQKNLWKKLMVCYTVKSKRNYLINKNFFDLIIFENFKP